jgi:hypothetical protein
MYWAWIGIHYLFQINVIENAEESSLAVIVFLDIIQPSFILFKIRCFRDVDYPLGLNISIGSKWIGFHLKVETESSLWNVVCFK